MCCDLIFVILLCKHVGEMVQEKGRNPLLYQVLMAVGWIGGEVIGGIIGVMAAILLSDGNEEVIELGIVVGVVIGLVCGAGPAYLLAMNVTRDPNYRPPQPAPGTSPYGPAPYGPAPTQNPLSQGTPLPIPAPAAPPPKSPAAPGIPSFLPASAFAPANPGPRRVQFYCPNGHLLEEWSTSAGEQRRCPHCDGVAIVPKG